MNMMPSKAASQREVETPSSLIVEFGADTPLAMDAGVLLSPFSMRSPAISTLPMPIR